MNVKMNNNHLLTPRHTQREETEYKWQKVSDWIKPTLWGNYIYYIFVILTLAPTSPHHHLSLTHMHTRTRKQSQVK